MDAAGYFLTLTVRPIEIMFDAVCSLNGLDDALRETDLLIMSLPGTPETAGIMDARRLSLLPTGAYLVDVGRGSAIDERTLETLLRSGRLAGAALDVFATEPLKPQDPLWDCPRLLITPHVSGNMTLPYTVERIVSQFLEDFENYMKSYQEKSSAMTAALRAKSDRMKELEELIRFAESFNELKPVYDELNKIKFRKAREKYKSEHERELRLFHLAKRKLDAAAPDHRIPIKAWQLELDELSKSYAAESEILKPIRAELKELYRIKSKLDPFLREASQDKNTENRKEKHAQKEEKD